MTGIATHLSMVSWDYGVIAAILVVPLLISAWYAFKDKNKQTMKEYLLGGQEMNILPVCLSIFITFMSSISMLGTPAEVFIFGTGQTLVYVGISLNCLVGAWLVVPFLHSLEVNSVYQYLEKRFQSRWLTTFITIVGSVRIVCTMAVVLLAPALALQASVGIPLWLSIIVIGGTGTFYTAIGGIKSVIWTDAFQTVIVFAGILACIVKGSVELDDGHSPWAIASEEGRINFDQKLAAFDPRIRMTVWGSIFSSFFQWMSNAFDQSSLQRVKSLKSVRQARLCAALTAPLTLLYFGVQLYVSIVMVAYFSATGCDPLKSGAVSSSNQLMPYYALHSMSDLPGMVGFYMASIFCQSLSTLSSGINALAAITVEGLLSSSKIRPSERQATLLTKVSVGVLGACVVGLAFGAQYMRGPVTQIYGTINGGFGSPVAGVFIIAALLPFTNKYGAMSGMLVSIVFTLFLIVGGHVFGAHPRPLPPLNTTHCEDPDLGGAQFNLSIAMNGHKDGISYSYLDVANKTIATVSSEFNLSSKHDPTRRGSASAFTSMGGKRNLYDPAFFLFDISYEWYSVIAILLCVVVGSAVSYATRHKISTKPDQQLIFPFCQRFWARRGYFRSVPSRRTTRELESFLPDLTRDWNSNALVYRRPGDIMPPGLRKKVDFLPLKSFLRG